MADKPVPGWSIPATFNAAVFGLTRALAIEMKPIRVNAVTPGLINTELLQGMNYSEEMMNAMKNMALTGSVGLPEDTAEAYIYLMKDKFATGSVIRTDGGRLLT